MNTRPYLRLLRTFALAILTAAAVTACTDDNGDPAGSEPLTPPNGNDGIPVAFTADINPGSDADPAAAPDTRTVLTPTDGNGFTVTWKGKNDHQNNCDKINIWAVHEQGAKANNGNPVTYVPTTSAVSSSLEPEQQALSLSSEGPWTFTAVYGNSEITGNMAYAELSSLTQSEPDKTDHIAAQDFSVATVTQPVTAGDMPQNIGLQFNHLLSALQLKVTNETYETLNIIEIRLSVKEDQITSRKGCDVATGKWEAGEGTKSDYLQLKITNPSALATGGKASQNFHMLLFPGYANTDMTITVITNRGEYTLTKGAPDGGFAAGINYTVNVAVKSSVSSGETWTKYTGISNQEELIAFREQVNNGTSYYLRTVRLLNDIILTEMWTPIGNDTRYFRGTFDGGGHHISGLNVDNSNAGYAGLFGQVYISGTVRNLRVSGDVTTSGDYAGGIVGELYEATVENCLFDGTVNGKQNVGGIAGKSWQSSRITGCYTKGTVTATNNTAGGIVGGNDNSSIENCYSEAEVKSDYFDGGGIAGTNYGTISHCYATGAISGTYNAGGIAGNNYGYTVSGCIALNPSIKRKSGAKTTFGRIAGDNTTGTADNCAAFEGMTITDGTSDITNRTGADGDGISASTCLSKAAYTSRGFTEATATTPGWAFDSSSPWTYLPWNPAFETFSGIQPADYRISVPNHLNGGN